MNGFVKIHRGLLEWEWYDDINTFKLFMHLIFVVNYKENKWHGITLKKGETVKSLSTLSQETKLSIQQIRTSIKKLKSTQEITERQHNKYRIIKVNNYEKYQTNDTEDNTKITSKQQQSNIKITTDKERKERKEKKEVITPKKISKSFFENKDNQEEIVKKIVHQKQIPASVVRNEIEKFVNYWTESAQSGTKMRWEMQKTFEVPRRLATWFANADKFKKPEKKGFTVPKNF